VHALLEHLMISSWISSRMPDLVVAPNYNLNYKVVYPDIPACFILAFALITFSSCAFSSFYDTSRFVGSKDI
jgi:hypothetical protein